MKKMIVLLFVCALILSCGGGNKARIEITINPDPVINPEYEPGTTSRGRVLVFIYGIDEDGNEIEAEGRINLQLTN